MRADRVRQFHVVTVAAFDQRRRRQMMMAAPLVPLGAAGPAFGYGHYILNVKNSRIKKLLQSLKVFP